jgi:hypothetical protein
MNDEPHQKMRDCSETDVMWVCLLRINGGGMSNIFLKSQFYFVYKSLSFPSAQWQMKRPN